jgi:hypothetical protein
LFAFSSFSSAYDKLWTPRFEEYNKDRDACLLYARICPAAFSVLEQKISEQIAIYGGRAY